MPYKTGEGKKNTDAEIRDAFILRRGTVSEIASFYDGANIFSRVAYDFENFIDAPEAASICDSANLTAAKAASITDSANLTAAKGASIYENANLTVSKIASICDSANLTAAKAASICDSANLTAAKGASIYDSANLTAAKLISILDNANITSTKISDIFSTGSITIADKRGAVLEGDQYTAADAATDVEATYYTAAELASGFDSANLTAAKGASICDSANLTAAKGASICDSANLTAAKAASIYENDNLTVSKIASICDSANLSETRGLGILENTNLSLSKINDIIIHANIGDNRAQQIVEDTEPATRDLTGASNIYEFLDDWDDNKLTSRDDADVTATGFTNLFAQLGHFRPEWTTESGSPSLTGGILTLPAGDVTLQHITTPSSFITGTWEVDVKYVTVPTSTFFFFYPFVDVVGSGGSENGYYYAWETDEVPRFKRVDSGSGSNIIVGTETIRDTSFHTHKVTRDSDGNWEIFIDGTSKGTYTDTDYTTANYIQQMNKANEDTEWDNLEVY